MDDTGHFDGKLTLGKVEAKVWLNRAEEKKVGMHNFKKQGSLLDWKQSKSKWDKFDSWGILVEEKFVQ